MVIIHNKLGVIDVPQQVRPFHILFECASGYALFLAPGVSEVERITFQGVEEYINRSPQPFELIDFQSFSSPDDALAELKAISDSTVTDKLKKFLEKNLPHPRKYTVSTADSMLGARIIRKTGLGVHCSILIDDAMRGLRDKIDKVVGLEPGVLENAQLNLARLHNQMCTEMDTRSPFVVSTSSYLQEQVGVVPHRIEGIFKIKGKENVLCTRNLVPGEALHGEKLLSVQNEDN